MVSVAVPPPELVTFTGLVEPKLKPGRFCAPAGLDVIAAVNETLPAKPPEPEIVMTSVVVPPCVTETVGAFGASTMLGAAFTVKAIVVEADMLPAVPLMVTVAVPVVAVLPAVSVTTLVPLVGLVAKAAVTPLGKPVAASVTLPVNPLKAKIVIVSDALLPCTTASVGAVGDSVKIGGVLTVSAIVVDAVRLPEVPVMVTVAAPVAAVPLAVNVTPLDPVVGFVAKLAVTPLGRPVAVRVTLPVNPVAGVTVIVSDALLP
jgi:hypothetical protein